MGGETMTKDQPIEVLKQRLLALAEEIQDISNQLATLAESILRSQENT
jgi:prefoldin subunit 5